MKIISFHPKQSSQRLTIKTDTDNIVLYRFGEEIICPNPPEKLNKQSARYIALKKLCKDSPYFERKERPNEYSRKEIQARLKIFLNTNL